MENATPQTTACKPLSGLMTLSEIFTNRFFRIPDFQRGFSWEKEQLEDLWDDINELGVNESHYMNFFIVKSFSDKDNFDKDTSRLKQKGFTGYWLIDGQQRLTALCVLIHEILAVSKEKKVSFNIDTYRKKYLFHISDDFWLPLILHNDENSKECFEKEILKVKGDTKGKQNTFYTSCLIATKDYFNKKLKDFQEEQLILLLDKLFNKLIFNCYEISNNLNEYVAFECINNRGKEPSFMELLKNRLLYLSTFLEDDSNDAKEQLREKINDAYKSIYYYLGLNKKEPLDDDSFLSWHWVTYFPYNSKNYWGDFLLKEHFTRKNIHNRTLKLQDILGYITDLQQCVHLYYDLFNPNAIENNEIRPFFDKLYRLDFGSFFPLLLTILEKQYSPKENLNTKQLKDFLESCERFVFLVFKVSGKRSNSNEAEFYKMANQYKNNSISLDEITQRINDLIDGNEEIDGLLDLETFKNRIDNYFKLSGNDKKRYGFYAWEDGLKYFLYEYELWCQEKNKEIKAPAQLDYEDVHIEHILPRKPKDEDIDAYWQKKFDCFYGRETKEKRKQQIILTNTLGNLVLLRGEKNESLGRQPFQKKENAIKQDLTANVKSMMITKIGLYLLSKNAGYTC